MRAASKWIAWGVIVALGLLLLSPPAGSAPKDESALQPLFDKSKAYGTVKGKPNKDGSITFGVPFGKKDEETVYIQELPDTGTGWVWSIVVEFDSRPPAGLYKRLAEINDQSRWGYLSWAGNDTGGGTVFLNFFFLTRTADTKAIEQYIDTAISERTRMMKELRDFLP
jgi:hypothetical protein